jgi:hypothetical protein
LGGAVAAPENGDALDSAIMWVMRGRRNGKSTVIVCRFTVGYAVKKPGSCCRITGKPLTDSRNISKYLYGFSPCPLAVSLTDANMKRFMWVSSSAIAGNSLRSGSLSFCRSGPVVWPCCRNMASTIWRGDRE